MPEVLVEQSAEWVARQQPGLLRFLRCLGVPDADADDVAQATLLKALDAEAARLDAEKAGAWLRTTARRLWLDELRRKKRQPVVDLDAAERAFARCEGDDDGLGYRQALDACLERLGARDRRALELRYGGGASRGAIGQALGLGDEGIKALLRRVRARLKTCIETRRRA